jgi:glutamyl-tRNA synthetase
MTTTANHNKSVRTRFAPSPTGYLHVGGLRTALYSYLLAKQNGGQFLLRLEDTDTERYVEGAAEKIYDGLKWAGLQYDEGPDIGGPCGPYVQSQRLEIYRQHADALIKNNKAYYCFCTPETLEQMRQEQIAKKQAPKYDRRCLKLSPEEIKKKLDDRKPHVIRMKIPENRVMEFNDLVRDKVAYNTNELNDQVLLKSDGYPTYFLAAVVDDHLMQISHVTRTEEWLSSTPKLILLYEYFGWEAPQWAHLPLLLNTDKSKMSKRKGDVAVEDYIKKGYLAVALVNYLAFLGWNPGTEKEIYSENGDLKELLQNLQQDFSLERVHKAGAVFNTAKLNWYNGYYIKKLGNAELLEKCRPYLPAGANFNDEQLIKMLDLEKERSQTLVAIRESVKFYFAPPRYEKELLRWKKMTDHKVKESLEIAQKIFASITDNDFNAKNLSGILLAEAEKIGDRGVLLWPLRAALSGQKNSPPPFEIAEILGKKECFKRINNALKLF